MPTNLVTVVGDRDSVLGFRALGVNVKTPRADAGEIRRAVQEAIQEGAAVVFMAERFAEHIPDLLGELSRRPLPSVVIIPDGSGAGGAGLRKLDEITVRAIGSRGSQGEKS